MFLAYNMIPLNMTSFLYKISGIIGGPSVPSGYIPPNQGAARIAGALNVMITIALILATFYFIYAGYLYISSSGDPGKVKTAQASMQWATIGILVSVTAYLLVGVIAGAVGVTNFKLPF